jgi:formate-dependent nitrite reductase membrane component NrfD
MSRKFSWFLLFIRVVLGLIFLISATLKLSEPAVFAQSIVNYQVFGFILSQWGAVLIPVLEILLGMMLLTRLWLKEALILTLGLYLIFDVMILQAYFRGLDVACGCFNPADQSPIDVYKLIENFLLTTLSVLSVILYWKINRADEI